MKVILRENVKSLGDSGALVEVAPGYARNFLLPRGLAVEATGANLARREAEVRREADRKRQELAAARQLAERLKGQSVSVSAKAGEQGRLFGSITAGDIAGAVESQFGVALDKRRVLLSEPLKTLGDHEVRLHLHTDVEVRLNVRVIAS